MITYVARNWNGRPKTIKRPLIWQKKIIILRFHFFRYFIWVQVMPNWIKRSLPNLPNLSLMVYNIFWLTMLLSYRSHHGSVSKELHQQLFDLCSWWRNTFGTESLWSPQLHFCRNKKRRWFQIIVATSISDDYPQEIIAQCVT